MGDSRILSKLEFYNFFNNIDEYDNISSYQFESVVGSLVGLDVILCIKLVKLDFHLSLYHIYSKDYSGSNEFVYLLSQQIEMEDCVDGYLRKIVYFVDKSMEDVVITN